MYSNEDGLLRPASYHQQQPQYVVINPMHIITLRKQKRTFGVRVVEHLKAFSEKWFSHVLLMAFLMLYASLGAILFQWAEAPLETRHKTSIVRMRRLIASHMLQFRNLSDYAWVDKANERLHEYELQLQEHELSGVPQDSERQVWTFWGALFYAGTIFTTIGYGHIAPATTAGQAITIAYAFIGIPFLLMVLADLGKLFTRWIKAVLYYTKLFCKTGSFRQKKKKEKQTTATPIQYMSVAPNKMSYTVPYNGPESNSGTPAEPGADDVKDSDENSKEKSKDKKKSDNEIVEEINTKDFAIASEEDEVDEEFNIPVTLAIFLLMAYMMLGALLFTLWEDWTFTESFYFIFISMSTIGFGDYVPTHQMFMMATFIYLLFGLALTSMCINVVQEKLSLTFQAAKLRIGTTIGLDTSTLVDDDRMSDEASSRRGSKSRRSSKSARSTTPQAEDGPDQALQSESKD